VLLHGKGGDAARMVRLGTRVAAGDVAIIAPAADEGAWWPRPFAAALAPDDPDLAGALDIVEAAVSEALGAGLPPENILVGGFSQGACLALEHAARAGRHYRAIVAMSGAFLATAPRDDLDPADRRSGPALTGAGSEAFAGLTVAVSCHAADPHIPLRSVEATAAWLQGLGADVALSIVPGARHGILRQDIAVLRRLFASQETASSEQIPPHRSRD